MWDGDTIDTYRLEDAEVVVFAINSMAAELKLSVDILRDEGIKAGLLRPRLYLPFPAEDIIQALPKNAQVMVLDRNYNFSHPRRYSGSRVEKRALRATQRHHRQEPGNGHWRR